MSTWIRAVTCVTVGVTFLFTVVAVGDAHAERREGEVRSLTRQYRTLDRSASRLLKRFNKLNTTQKSDALSQLSGRYDDADDDGVPDFLDDGSGRCNSDRDDDGIPDGDEYSGGSDPGNDDSDDDGISDGLEREVHALISEISESSITVGGYTFALTENTSYLDKRKRALERSDFAVGACVEVEGHVINSTLVAQKVKVDNDC